MSQDKFSILYDDFIALMKKRKLGLGEFTAACLSWVLTFSKETVPKENRMLLLQKIR
jgi:hypothetical protein